MGALRNRGSALVNRVTAWAGSGAAIAGALLLLAAWTLVGAWAGFDSLWLDLLEAVTGATTFVMVFLLRHSEGRDARAMLAKLDELIAAVEGTDERIIGIENRPLDEQEEAEQRPAGSARG